MRVYFRIGLGSPSGKNLLSSILNPLCTQRPNLSRTLTLAMATQATSKRPMCPSCSKPTRLCLCARIKTPSLENSVAVTILQHSLERDHPLNSTRIATLGLKNLTLATVSDVNFESRLAIRLLESDSESGCCRNVSDFVECRRESSKPVYEEELRSHVGGSNLQCGNMGIVRNSEIEPFLVCPEEKSTKIIDINGECSLGNDFNGARNCRDHYFVQNSGLSTSNGAKTFSMKVTQSDLDMVSAAPTLNEAILDNRIGVTHGNDPIGVVLRGNEEAVVTATIAKYGVIGSLSHLWMPQTKWQKPDFDRLLESPVARDALSKGFVVKKFQKRQLNENMELEEYEEFELVIPPGSILLFPTEKSIGVEDIDFEVKNLIVLDGTWAKAKRMYNENPWLKLLPHLKLDLDKMSLYSEVRHQPRAGYLSTIESIVYALKAVGYNPKGLDNLLDVFESMVGDQRRCKDERLNKVYIE